VNVGSALFQVDSATATLTEVSDPAFSNPAKWVGLTAAYSAKGELFLHSAVPGRSSMPTMVSVVGSVFAPVELPSTVLLDPNTRVLIGESLFAFDNGKDFVRVKRK
jgi:hypothetical protein